MDVLFIDSQKYGYDYVTISDGNTILYEGRCGTIPIKSDAEYLEITVKNNNYEVEKQIQDQKKRILHLLLMIVVGLLGSLETQGLGKPYYFKLKVKRQLFMQLHYDNVFTHYFTSNVTLIQERVKDSNYIKFWLFSYVIPLQLIILVLYLMVIYTLGSLIIASVLGIIAIVFQLFLLHRLSDELR